MCFQKMDQFKEIGLEKFLLGLNNRGTVSKTLVDSHQRNYCFE